MKVLIISHLIGVPLLFSISPSRFQESRKMNLLTIIDISMIVSSTSGRESSSASSLPATTSALVIPYSLRCSLTRRPSAWEWIPLSPPTTRLLLWRLNYTRLRSLHIEAVNIDFTKQIHPC
jgi:hypothetical protein